MRYALVACVSGRPGDRAREIVGVPELTYVGEHGLELDPEAERWAPLIHAFAAERRLVGRGQAAVRRVPLPHRAGSGGGAPHARGGRAAAVAEGFRTRWGRLVLEVLPPLETSKGTAVRRLLATTGATRALYAGDDTTDLDGFAALDGLEVAVRIAVSRPKAPTTSPSGPTGRLVAGRADGAAHTALTDAAAERRHVLRNRDPGTGPQGSADDELALRHAKIPFHYRVRRLVSP